MPDIRSAAQLNGIPMSGLLGASDTFNVYRAVCSTSINPTTTEIDVTGATVSVVVPTASSVVLIWATFDLGIATIAGSLNAYINWNGVDSPAFSMTDGRTVSYRATLGFAYTPAITASGTFTCKLRASSTTSTTDFAVRSAHTTLTVLVIGS